jgi:excinuclease ABC subunit B
MAILYADKLTDSMKAAIGETERRRKVQIAYNEEHGIIPKGIQKRIKDMIEGIYDPDAAKEELKATQSEARYDVMSEKDLTMAVKRTEKEMMEAARNLEFERAAKLRDELKELKSRLFVSG